jgi:hypothetical protein
MVQNTPWMTTPPLVLHQRNTIHMRTQSSCDACPSSRPTCVDRRRGGHSVVIPMPSRFRWCARMPCPVARISHAVMTMRQHLTTTCIREFLPRKRITPVYQVECDCVRAQAQTSGNWQSCDVSRRS